MEGDSALLPESVRQVALLMLKGFPTSPEISARLGLEESAIRHTLGKLEEAGLVEAQREGRMNRYLPNEELREAAKTWGRQVG